MIKRDEESETKFEATISEDGESIEFTIVYDDAEAGPTNLVYS